MQPRRASSSVRAPLLRWRGFGCATLIGSVRAQSPPCRRTACRLRRVFARRVRPRPRCSCPRARSSSLSPKSASRPVKPAFFMIPSIPTRGCSGAGSSWLADDGDGREGVAALDDESVFGAKPKPRLTHEIGQNVDDLSAPELTERIALLRSEIGRLEKAIEARQVTRAAADSVFKI